MAGDRDQVSMGNREMSASEIQRLLREKRESISLTVQEIKSTMEHEYTHTRQTVTDNLDWRHQMRRYPLAAAAGALALGFLAGRILGREVHHGGHLSYGNDHGHAGLAGTSTGEPGSAFGAGAGFAPSRGAGSTASAGFAPVSGASVSPVGSSPRSTQSRSHETRHLLPPKVRSRVGGRFEDLLADMAENFLNEVQKVGREVIVPNLINSLTTAVAGMAAGGAMGHQDRNVGHTGSGAGLRSMPPAAGPQAGFSASGSGSIPGSSQTTGGQEGLSGRNF